MLRQPSRAGEKFFGGLDRFEIHELFGSRGSFFIFF